MLTTEQLKIRGTGIGASEIAAVVGLNPFSAPIDVWLNKTGRATEEPDPEGDSHKDLGHRVETVLADVYAARTGAQLETCKTIVHPTEPWILATPDRHIVGTNRGVEIKLVGMHVVWHWTDEAPPDYLTLGQCQWQMLVTGWESIEVVALIGGTDFRVYSVPRDDETIEMLMTIGRRFWHEHVLADVPPPADGTDSYKAFLARRFPRSGPGLTKAPPEAERSAREYLQAAQDEVESAARKQAAANHLKSMIGEFEGIVGEFGRVTWKSNAKGIRSIKVTLRDSKSRDKEWAA